MRRPRPAHLIWLGAMGLAFVAYLPALRAGWVLDDLWNIVEAPSLHWTSLSGDAFSQLLSQSLLTRRVIPNLSFALNHMAGGLEPGGYHLANILIHLLTGTALLWLATLYLRGTPGRGEGSLPLVAVLLPPALFLVHPVNTQAVTYVVQRMASLAALFCILSFAAYLKGRHSASRGRALGWFAASLGFWVLGLASKENAVILPLVLLTWEVCCGGITLPRVRSAWRRVTAPTRVAALTFLVLAAGLVIMGGLRFLGTPADWTVPFRNRDFSGLERMLTQTRVGILYLTLILWPSPGRLNLDYDFSVSRSILDPPSTLLAVGFWAVAVPAAVLLTRRRPMWGFPILAYLECHLLEAGPVNLEMVFEHRLYLPLAMLTLLPASFLAAVPRERLRSIVGAGVVMILTLATATFVRNTTWADPIELQRDIARKSPRKPRAHVNLAEALLEGGRAAEAMEPARRAVVLDPTSYESLLKLGDVYRATAAPDSAYETFRRAAALDPGRFDAHFRAGLALEEAGRTEQATRYLLAAGADLGRAGRAFEAMPLLEKAVELSPGSSVAHNQMGNAYQLANFGDRALAEYEAAVRLDSTNVEATYNLATVLERMGRIEAALTYYGRFVEIAPEELSDAVEAVRRKLAVAGDPPPGRGAMDAENVRP